jgi:hypothetical protein
VSLHSSLLTKLLLVPQKLLPRVLLVGEDLDNKAFQWFTVADKVRRLELRLNLKSNLEFDCCGEKKGNWAQNSSLQSTMMIQKIFARDSPLS